MKKLLHFVLKATIITFIAVVAYQIYIYIIS